MGPDSDKAGSAGPQAARFLLGAALAVTVLMAGLRTGPLTGDTPGAMAPPAGAQSALEARLTSLLETVLGAGAVRVHQSVRPDASRSLLILVDDSREGLLTDEAITDLLHTAYFVDAVRGDTLTVRRAAFAPSASAAPAPAQWIELGGFALLALLLAGALFALPKTAPRPRAHIALTRSPAPRDFAASAPRNSEEAVEAIRDNPARAAEILRDWIGRDGGKT